MAAHGLLIFTGKKLGCRRVAGLLGPPQTPGRKRSAEEAGLPEAPRDDDPCLPSAYIVGEIAEIWGQRRAACLACPALA